MAAATDEGEIVKSVIEEVREHLGKGDALAIALEKAGYAGKVSSRYSASVVSSWVTGRAMPGADVFLAAAKLVNISLDEYLYKEDAATDRKERQRLARLEGMLERETEARLGGQENLKADLERVTKLVELIAEKLKIESSP